MDKEKEFKIQMKEVLSCVGWMRLRRFFFQLDDNSGARVLRVITSGKTKDPEFNAQKNKVKRREVMNRSHSLTRSLTHAHTHSLIRLF